MHFSVEWLVDQKASQLDKNLVVAAYKSCGYRQLVGGRVHRVEVSYSRKALNARLNG